MMDKLCECVSKQFFEELTPRSTSMIIAVIGLIASLADFFTLGEILNITRDKECKCCMVEENNLCIKKFLLKVYQVANVVLFVGCVLECPYMLQLYIWYTLSFIVFEFIVTMVEFVYNIQRDPYWTLVSFVTDITYLFVLFWCLPVIDSYRKSMAPCPGMKMATSHDQVV